MTVSQIRSEPLSSSIKRLLLDRIVRGELVPGERIVESRLAKELEISQSPVREALRDLAAIGLVEIESHRGARVRQPSTAELRDVSEVRSEMDAMAARLAASRMNDETAQALRDAHAQMIECHDREDYVGMTEADAGFHRLIAEASGNGAIERVFAQLEPFARTFITLTSPDVDLSAILDDHGEILNALVAGDPEEAANCARCHQLRVRDAFFEGAVDSELLDDGDAERTA